MANHLKFIHTQVAKSIHQLENELKEQHQRSECNIDMLLPRIDRIEVEEVKLGGSIKLIRRVFIQSDDSGKYAKLGWVLLNDVDCCMICVMKFKGLFTSHHKYHCHACGNIVCSSCADSFSQVLELQFNGFVRVCKSCYFGQVIKIIACIYYHIYV